MILLALLLSNLIFIPIVSTSFFSNRYTSTEYLFFFSTCILMSLVLLKEKINFPEKPPFRTYLASCLLIILYIFGFFIHSPGYERTYLLHWSAFFISTLAAYVLVRKDKDKFFSSLVLTNGIGAFFCTGFELSNFFNITPQLPHFVSRLIPEFPMGGRQFFAEFLGISFLIQLFSLQEKKWLLAKYIIAAFTVFHLMRTGSRSVLLACWIAFPFLWVFSQQKLVLFKRYFVTLIFSLITFFSFNKIHSSSSITFTNETKAAPIVSPAKTYSANMRIVRWKNTMAMVLDRPFFGVGAGKYDFAYPAYFKAVDEDTEVMGEHVVVNSPHNGYLELLSENGIFVTLIFLYLFLIWFIKTFKNYKSEKREYNYSLLLSLFIFISIDAFFSFPLEVPYPFFISSLVLGSSFVLNTKTKSLPLNSRFNLLLAPLLVTIAVIGTLMGISEHSLTQENPPLSQLETSCFGFPDQWQTCLLLADTLGLDDRPLHKKVVLEFLLERSSHHFPAILSLGRQYEYEKNFSKACEHYKRYDRIFMNRSSVKGFIEQSCD